MRKPSPFRRSRPFFQSSWPIMNETSPAFSEMPMTLPSSFFQVSSTPKPRTSRYQPRLFSRSSTVKLGEAERSASDSPPLPDLRVAAFARGAAFFVERRLFAVFFAAMWSSRRRGYDPGKLRVKGVSLRLASGSPPGDLAVAPRRDPEEAHERAPHHVGAAEPVLCGHLLHAPVRSLELGA